MVPHHHDPDPRHVSVGCLLPLIVVAVIVVALAIIGLLVWPRDL